MSWQSSLKPYHLKLFFSNKYSYAQIVRKSDGNIVAAASSIERTLRETLPKTSDKEVISSTVLECLGKFFSWYSMTSVHLILHPFLSLTKPWYWLHDFACAGQCPCMGPWRVPSMIDVWAQICCSWLSWSRAGAARHCVVPHADRSSWYCSQTFICDHWSVSLGGQTSCSRFLNEFIQTPLIL